MTCVAEVDSPPITGAPGGLERVTARGPRGRLVLDVAVRAAVGFAAAWVLITGLAGLGIYGDAGNILDVGLFQGWGRDVLLGRIPYLDFDLEYPPLGLVAFVLPSLLVGVESTDDTAHRRNRAATEGGQRLDQRVGVRQLVVSIGAHDEHPHRHVRRAQMSQ